MVTKTVQMVGVLMWSCILHQPVILILGYFIVPLPIPILAKYLIIAPLAFGTTLGLYKYGVRMVACQNE